MTIAIGQNQERGLFDLCDDWLKRDRFVFVGCQKVHPKGFRLRSTGSLQYPTQPTSGA